MLGFLSALIFGKNCVTEMCEKELPAEYHGNWKLEEHDANEVRMGRMTQKQFEKNMENGKYYAPPKPDNELDPKILRNYYGMKWRGTFNEKCDYGKYNFIKELSTEEAKKRYFETFNKTSK